MKLNIDVFFFLNHELMIFLYTYLENENYNIWKEFFITVNHFLIIHNENASIVTWEDVNLI